MNTSVSVRKQGAKLSRAEKGLLVSTIVDYLLNHYRTSDIALKIAEKFGISERMAWKYVRDGKEWIATNPQEYGDRARNIAIQEVEEMLRGSMEPRDRIIALKHKHSLQGLSDITINHNHKKLDVDDDKLLEIVSEQ